MESHSLQNFLNNPRKSMQDIHELMRITSIMNTIQHHTCTLLFVFELNAITQNNKKLTSGTITDKLK